MISCTWGKEEPLAGIQAGDRAAGSSSAGKALRQPGAKRGCAITILRGFQDWTRRNLEQPSLTSWLSLLSARGWTQRLPEVPFDLKFLIL